MLKNRFRILVAGVIVGMFWTTVCFAALSDELTTKAVNVAGALSRGDSNGALQGAIGGYNLPVTPQTNLSLGAGNVGIQQAIKPLGFSNPYLNVGSTYNAGTTFGLNRTPNLSQNFQVNSGNGYFSNSTSIPIKLKRS